MMFVFSAKHAQEEKHLRDELKKKEELIQTQAAEIAKLKGQSKYIV